MRCKNHLEVTDGLARCADCRRYFCPDCLAEVFGAWRCISCKAARLDALLAGARPGDVDPLASPWWRWVAWTIDGFVQVIFILPIIALMGATGALTGNSEPGVAVQLLGNAFMFGGGLLYEGLMLQWRSQTLGKIALRIRVTDAAGAPIGPRHAWLRGLIRALINLCCMLVDYLPAFFHPQRQTLHDMAAGTTVRRCSYAGLSCPRCGRTLKHGTMRTGDQICPSCGGSFEALRLEPVEAPEAEPELAAVGPEASAPCARHARNRAVAPCQRCGQFLCALCRMEADRAAYCPPCFERLFSEGQGVGAFRPRPNYVGWAAMSVLAASQAAFMLPIGFVGLFFAVKGLLVRSRTGEGAGGWAHTKAILWCLGSIAACVGFWGLIAFAITQAGAH